MSAAPDTPDICKDEEPAIEKKFSISVSIYIELTSFSLENESMSVMSASMKNASRFIAVRALYATSLCFIVSEVAIAYISHCPLRVSINNIRSI